MSTDRYHNANEHDPIEQVDNQERKNESKEKWPFSRTTAKQENIVAVIVKL